MSNRSKLKHLFEQVLNLADIKINGNRPWDMMVNDPNIYERVFQDGVVGLGEGYMIGEWDSKDLVELIARFFRQRLDTKLKTDLGLLLRVLTQSAISKLQRLVDRDSQARKLAKRHYDLGNDFYKAFLDKRMLYTCGYWENAKTLDEAEENKLNLACRKLGLKKGMRVLDIGGGWGGLAIYAAEKFEVNVVSITISREQLKEAEKRRLASPKSVAERIENRFSDYRDVKDGPYDRIIVMGMIEHIKHENYPTIMKVIANNLAEDGLFLLHTIGTDDKDAWEKGNWMEKYIFPNSEIPNSADLVKSYQGFFVMEDWHNFGAHYERTCIEWFKKFDKNWNKLKSKFDPDSDRFYRMWKLYLLGCAGSFRARSLQLWQIVLSKGGIPGGYQSVR